jgi:transcriptional regulator with XRE-family HTH domain
MSDFDKLKELARENKEVEQYLESFAVQLGKLIFELRHRNEISKFELAIRAGLTQTIVERIEAGDPLIEVENYNKVFRVLKINKIELS